MSVTELLKEQSPASKRHVPQWIDRVDVLLDLHRIHFLPRQPTASELDLHKAALELALQTGKFLSTFIDDPEIGLRLGLLADAHTLFHNPPLSPQETERQLREVFPE